MYLGQTALNWKTLGEYDPVVLDYTEDTDAMSKILTEFVSNPLNEADYRFVRNGSVINLLRLLQVTIKFQMKSQNELEKALNSAEEKVQALERSRRKYQQRAAKLATERKEMEEEINCPLCSERLDGNQTLDRHIRRQHKDRAIFWIAFKEGSLAELEEANKTIQLLKEEISIQNEKTAQMAQKIEEIKIMEQKRFFKYFDTTLSIPPEPKRDQVPLYVYKKARTIQAVPKPQDITDSDLERMTLHIKEAVRQAAKDTARPGEWNSVRKEIYETIGEIHDFPRPIVYDTPVRRPQFSPYRQNANPESFAAAPLLEPMRSPVLPSSPAQPGPKSSPVKKEKPKKSNKSHKKKEKKSKKSHRKEKEKKEKPKDETVVSFNDSDEGETKDTLQDQKDTKGDEPSFISSDSNAISTFEEKRVKIPDKSLSSSTSSFSAILNEAEQQEKDTLDAVPASD